MNILDRSILAFRCVRVVFDDFVSQKMISEKMGGLACKLEIYGPTYPGYLIGSLLCYGRWG
jgi:hypothetical protein